MDGRFPVDFQQAQLQQQQLQLNQQAAQLRAALGLPPGVDAGGAAQAYLQAAAQEREWQWQQQAAQEQRDLQIRQLLLQEQLEQRLTEQRLLALREQQQRVTAATAAAYPTLTDDYQSVLHQEQLLQQLRAGEAAQHQHQQLLLQDALRLHQLGGGDLVAAPVVTSGALYAAPPGLLVPRPSLVIDRSHPSAVPQPASPGPKDRVKDPDRRKLKKEKRRPERSDEGSPVRPPKPSSDKGASESDVFEHPQEARSPMKVKRSKEKVPGRKPGRPRKERPEVEPPQKRKYTRRKKLLSPVSGSALDEEEGRSDMEADALGGLLRVAKKAGAGKKGRVDEIMDAADIDDAAEALCHFKDIDGNTTNGKHVVLRPGTPLTLHTPTFTAEIPALPEEPAMWMPYTRRAPPMPLLESAPSEENDVSRRTTKKGESNSKPVDKTPKKRKISAITNYPYPVDTWWPSNSGIQRERHQAGETSDEDDFEDPPHADPSSCFRANETKICERLANDVQPGVLEKLPHCKIHRLADVAGQSGVDEFLHCVQTAELYPDELMVNCTVCGTWRHAACGGHYTSCSNRSHPQSPFVCVCDLCHQEAKFLKRYKKGAQRLERQRMEHLRRALATTAVMRQAALAEQPLKLKSPSSIVGDGAIAKHARSVKARFEKTEKMWASMVENLSETNEASSKIQARTRAKEFERLLVAVEDAESYRDRHNMILFLIRDTSLSVPVGFENQPKNIFDPEEWPHEARRESADEQSFKACARKNCNMRRRFDSLFCSDGCGVSVLEEDLLKSLQEANEMHPSLLRAR